MRRAEAQRRGREQGWREIAEHRPPAVAAADAPAGGELTVDEFVRAASAAAQDDAVAVDAAPGRPAIAEPVETADMSAARVKALVHPSHEELAEEVATPTVLPGLYRNGRLVVPAPLKGSHDILIHQNMMANDAGLVRIRDDEQLNQLRAQHVLVDFPESVSLRLNPELSYDRRCARVWTVRFAADTARAFYARFHEPLQLNSAVRTIAYQLRLQRTNGNAAPVAGDVASPHLTGQAIDFGKRGMTMEELAWMRAYLKPLMDAGKVDVEEEFQQACFHISVYPAYMPAKRMQVAQVQGIGNRE
jgi:hypothetical protein